jgi:hypothetical protein
MIRNKILSTLIFTSVLSAQEDHAMAGMGDSAHPETHSQSPSLNGSGTSRLPETTPMHAIHSNRAGWELMTHGSFYLRYTNQNGNNPDKRSDDDIDFPNWLMLMGGRDFSGGKHRVDIRTMFSLDPLTEGGNGYPLLFATGETWRDKPLVDRQHPHDLFMELATILTNRLSTENQVFLYLGLPGEPALGPTAFMHRSSNQTNPDAVISHHNQDATHITFGVATLGWMNRLFKVDGSIFTGREPDENRLDINLPRFDSYSLRLSYHPTRSLTAQVSSGFLKSPEAREPDEDLLRFTASLHHVLPFPEGNFLSSSMVYGGNSHLGHDDALQNSFTFESEWDWNLGTVYGRVEAVQKTGVDLAIGTEEEGIWANALTLGSGIRLFRRFQMQTLLGAQGTMNLPEKELRAYYGNFPLSFEVYIKFSPDIMMMTMEPEKKKNGGHKERDKPSGTETHGGHQNAE